MAVTEANHWLTVTVAVLTFNGERYLDRMLHALEQQDYSAQYDVLVIDSGSTDSTLDILSSHPSVRLHEIPNSEFGHGRTRNLAAEMATGEVLVMLTHDAIPLGEDWLRSMTEPFQNSRVALVLGRQEARPSAPPVVKYHLDRVFAMQGAPRGVTLHSLPHDESGAGKLVPASFFSDVACAIRREVLVSEIPYRDVDYAEDQILGREVLAAGYLKAYAGGAVVEHSNDGNLREFGERVLADRRGLNGIGVPPGPTSLLAAGARLVKWTVVDTGLLLRDRDFSVPQRVYWFFVNPIFHAVKWWNDRVGAREFHTPETDRPLRKKPTGAT